MTHFHIRHIDDVLPHLKDNPEFVVAQRSGYTVIDYQFAAPATFDHPAKFECRGLKFGPDGRIIARPLHKFFNVGEKPDTQPHLLDFDQPHVVMEKMDGSMIHPAIIDGQLRLMTRMGCTDHAAKAERHLTDDIREWCHANQDLTPIFEWTAPDNRIVVPYADSRLTLLAVREIVSGHYLARYDLEGIALQLGVPAVTLHQSGPDFLAHARAVRGMEGFVVRFASGLWVKAKGEDYVLKHKAKESVLQEKNVLALVLRSELDDVLPLLEPCDRQAVETYRDGVLRGVSETVTRLDYLVGQGAALTQKEFAVSAVPAMPAELRSLAFKVRAGAPARDAVVSTILKQCGSASGVDLARPLFGAHFRADNDNLPTEQVA
ncbi:RNA ligase [Bosea sp. NPDC055332]